MRWLREIGWVLLEGACGALPRLAEAFVWFLVIFLAVYAAEMAAFHHQGRILLDNMR